MARNVALKKNGVSLNPTKNSLNASIRAKVVSLLNARLVDAIDLGLQAKQAHWNVKGSNFTGLHALFDQVAAAAQGYADEIAERGVELGGIAEGTVQMVASNTTLDAYPVDAQKSNLHVEALSSALGTFGRHVREAIRTAEDLGDDDTADLFTEISRDVDKWTWMVEAHNQ